MPNIIYFLELEFAVYRHLRRVFNEDVVRELMGSGEVISELEKEWSQLCLDRENLREIFPSGENKVVLPCNLKRMLWNAQKVFHINKRIPTDLNPLKVIQGTYRRCMVSNTSISNFEIVFNIYGSLRRRERTT